MANSSLLPEGDDLKASVILSFLVHRDWNDLPSHLKDDGKKLVRDQQAIINLSLEFKSFNLYLPDRRNKSTWTLHSDGEKFRIYATKILRS